MRDTFSCTKLAVLIPAAAYNADTTPAAVDIRGFRSALISLAVGVGGITFDATNKIEFKLTHSDDGVTFTAVTADDVLLPAGSSVGSGGIVYQLVAAHAAADANKIGYIGNKNHLKLQADFSGTHGTATPFAATVDLSDALYAPV